MVLERLGAVSGSDELRQPFDDRGLADPRLADQDRVVLLPPRQHLDDPLDFLLAADGRVEGAVGRQRGEVAAEMIQRGRLRLLLGTRRRAGGRALGGLRHVGAEKAEGFRPRLLEVDPGVGEHLGGDALLLAQQPEQEVLGAHVGVVQLPRLAHGQLEHLLGP